MSSAWRCHQGPVVSGVVSDMGVPRSGNDGAEGVGSGYRLRGCRERDATSARHPSARVCDSYSHVMDGTGAGTAIMLAVAALLWFVYLVPTWLRRREFIAAEHGAGRPELPEEPVGFVGRDGHRRSLRHPESSGYLPTLGIVR